jgi:carotenoid cleavage dioxygenase-like enzyme
MKQNFKNPFLVGNFAPLSQEIDSTELIVEGSIPKDLNGILIRNGPNPIALPDDLTTYHWFLGDGMLHAIYFESGRVLRYKNRYVKTRFLSSRSNFKAVPGPPEPINGPANTHIYPHANKLFALCESSLPHLVNWELETLCVYDFNGKLIPPMTAHPKTDPETKELCFFGYSPFGPPFLRYHVANKEGILTKSLEISLPACSMMHDFAITENFVIFLDLPVVFKPELAVNSYQMPFSWQPENGARIGILPREADSDKTKWIEIDPCYVFHVFNAFEERNQINLYLVAYKKMFDLPKGDLLGSAPPQMQKWVIDLKNFAVLKEQLSEDSAEFPRINDAFTSKKFRYGYSALLNEAIVKGNHDQTGKILKIDFKNSTTTYLNLGKYIGSAEPVFVSCGTNEDDGYLLTIGYDRLLDKSKLFIHHASANQNLPIATVTLPQRVPYGFHGSFVKFS